MFSARMVDSLIATRPESAGGAPVFRGASMIFSETATAPAASGTTTATTHHHLRGTCGLDSDMASFATKRVERTRLLLLQGREAANPGINSLVLSYKGSKGRLAAEVFEFAARGAVRKSAAHYDGLA